MKFLYIFPHPDDESFGPAAAIDQQLKQGHQVYLLTLTKGGATRQRHKLGLTIEEMGEMRHKEMLAVEQTLGLTGMTVWDFPDSGLKELDPRNLEQAVADHMSEIRPDIVVTYPVHGISGFHDHLITHAVVKRVFLELRDNGTMKDCLKRLAFFTVPDNDEPSLQQGVFRFKRSEQQLIDCVIRLSPENINAMKRGLNCYASYQETIEATGVVNQIGDTVYFEIFAEEHEPVLDDLTANLPN